MEVQAAVDGKNALEVLQTFAPELIILDLLLPDVDGFTVLAEMKKDSKFTSVPVIVLSNLDKPDDMQKAKGLGAKDFMVKSNFTLNEIVAKSKTALGIV
jgi:DNA-binding response OmpR family regulator